MRYPYFYHILFKTYYLNKVSKKLDSEDLTSKQRDILKTFKSRLEYEVTINPINIFTLIALLIVLFLLLAILKTL